MCLGFLLNKGTHMNKIKLGYLYTLQNGYTESFEYNPNYDKDSPEFGVYEFVTMQGTPYTSNGHYKYRLTDTPHSRDINWSIKPVPLKLGDIFDEVMSAQPTAEEILHAINMLMALGYSISKPRN